MMKLKVLGTFLWIQVSKAGFEILVGEKAYTRTGPSGAAASQTGSKSAILVSLGLLLDPSLRQRSALLTSHRFSYVHAPDHLTTNCSAS